MGQKIRIPDEINFTRVQGIVVLLCFVLSVFYVVAGSETLTLTTYYPAPYGAYVAMLTTNQTLLARDGGKVGIGTKLPAAKLDVHGGVRLAMDDSDCADANEGTQRYNKENKRMEFCAGAGPGGGWKPFASSGSGVTLTYYCYDDPAHEYYNSAFWNRCNDAGEPQRYCPAGYVQEVDLGRWGVCFTFNTYVFVPAGATGWHGGSCTSPGRAFLCRKL